MNIHPEKREPIPVCKSCYKNAQDDIIPEGYPATCKICGADYKTHDVGQVLCASCIDKTANTNKCPRCYGDMDKQYNCRICEAELIPSWKTQIRDRFKTRYYRCPTCGSLQLHGLEWLRDAYWGDTSIRHDEGRFRRNKIVYNFLDHIMHTSFKGIDIRLLDYGSGEEAILSSIVQKHNDRVETHNYDPYFNKMSSIPNGRFNIIMCIEVMEHLKNVDAFFEHIRSKIHRNGIVVCSTNLFMPSGPKAHTKSWSYLTPEIGQHITFWSKKSLRYMRKVIGAKKAAMVKFPSKIALEFFVFCFGASTNFIDKTFFKIELI